MAINTRADIIIQQIEAAFEGVRLDDGVSLREADVIDGCGSVEAQQAARLLDETEDWKQIPEIDLASSHGGFAFFDAKGVVFHLPAYMCHALRLCRPMELASYFTVTALGRNGNYIELMSESQREAVREFLRFMADLKDDFARAMASQALEEVWGN